MTSRPADPTHSLVCPCGHHADDHPIVWTIAGDATTACRVEGCRCRDYDGPDLPEGVVTPRPSPLAVLREQLRHLGPWRGAVGEEALAALERLVEAARAVDESHEADLAATIGDANRLHEALAPFVGKDEA